MGSISFAFFNRVFFQAEDGIRDWSVTGVQTCALPICGGVLETALQIQTDLLDQIGVLTEECVDTLQDGVEMDAQPAQFQVGEAELGVKSAAHKWLGISGGSPAEATCG